MEMGHEEKERQKIKFEKKDERLKAGWRKKEHLSDIVRM